MRDEITIEVSEIGENGKFFKPKSEIKVKQKMDRLLFQHCMDSLDNEDQSFQWGNTPGVTRPTHENLNKLEILLLCHGYNEVTFIVRPQL